MNDMKNKNVYNSNDTKNLNLNYTENNEEENN